MNDKKIKYRELVSSPRLLRVGAALLVSLLFWWMLVRGVYSTSGRTAAFFPSLVFICGLTLFGYGILSMLYGVRIRISQQWISDGTRQQILKIRGVIKGDRVNIPCRAIRDIQMATYEVPLWRALLGPFARQKYDGGHMVTLPGYQGTGLALTYTYEGVFSNESRELTILFPTRRPEELNRALEKAIQTLAIKNQAASRIRQ